MGLADKAAAEIKAFSELKSNGETIEVPKVIEEIANSPGISNYIAAKLQKVWNENELGKFYANQPNKLNETIAKAQRIHVNTVKLAAGIASDEIALDLYPLIFYDIVILADDSSSMNFEKDRLDDLSYIGETVAKLAVIFDQNGIEIHRFNSNKSMKNVTDSSQIIKFIEVMKENLNGSTPLAQSMQRKILDPNLQKLKNNNLEKPILVITITDGAPDDQNAVINMHEKLFTEVVPNYGIGAFRFQYSQVGKDVNATDFLQILDDPEHKKNECPNYGDMIDCTSYYEMEAGQFLNAQKCPSNEKMQLSVTLWTVKLIVGAIDNSYDKSDETAN